MKAVIKFVRYGKIKILKVMNLRAPETLYRTGISNAIARKLISVGYRLLINNGLKLNPWFSNVMMYST
jgi:hypothetical protein